MAAAGGVLAGILTALLPPLIDKINGGPGDLRIALVAIPFAILVCILVRRCSQNPWWAALTAAIVTMIAFVCAVNAAIWIDAQAGDANRAVRNILAGFAGGFTGAAILALDNALDLDLTSLLYPVWQAGVAVGLVMALRRTKLT